MLMLHHYDLLLLLQDRLAFWKTVSNTREAKFAGASSDDQRLQSFGSKFDESTEYRQA